MLGIYKRCVIRNVAKIYINKKIIYLFSFFLHLLISFFKRISCASPFFNSETAKAFAKISCKHSPTLIYKLNCFLIFILAYTFITINCSTYQDRSQVSIKLNKHFDTKSENLDIKNSSKLRKYYIENSNSAIELKIPNQVQVDMKDIINGNISDDLKDLNQYAFLSAYVYRDNTLNVSIKALKNNWKEINLKTKIKSVAWYQYKTCGLDFQIWKNEKINTIAIVFRGSEKQLGDWISNLRWFFLPRINPFIYDQYDQVRDSISDIVDELNSKYPNYKVVTAGHSLGGGLAQYAAYSGKSIKKVYAFDPSPVTGFYSVDCEIKKVSVRDLQIYRIYESGEILIIGRLFTKNPFSHESVDPEIVELRHNLLSGDMIEQHDISSFANELNKEFTKIKESDHTKEIQK